LTNQATNGAAYAPIALFAYRRADMLGAVLASLEACPEFSSSDVYIFSDGPKDLAARADVDAVRAMVRGRMRANMRLIEAAENLGLARSIINGVGRLCAQYGRAIVIEDDLLVSPAILAWFNASLDRYAGDPRVMQVSGHMFSSPSIEQRDEALFLPMITSWGWATWDRAWKTFDPDATGWEALLHDRKLRKRFDLDGAYPYTKMLCRQMAGQIDSWAIRWNWTLFANDGLALYPPRSLVANEGIDGNATHRGLGGALRRLVSRRKTTLGETVPAMPRQVTVDPQLYEAAKRSIWRSTSKLSPYHWLTR
jgi:hypothetical protein